MYPGGSAALGAQLQKIAQRTAAKKDNDTAQKLAAALRADGEKLCNDCVLPAADRYMGFVYDTFATALACAAARWPRTPRRFICRLPT